MFANPSLSRDRSHFLLDQQNATAKATTSTMAAVEEQVAALGALPARLEAAETLLANVDARVRTMELKLAKILRHLRLET